MRAGVDRFRRALMARSPVVRASLILVLVFGLAAAVYLGTTALVPAGTRYLASGRSFSSDDLMRIRQALDEKEIAYRVDDRKVEVSADQYDQAVAVFAKMRFGPQSFDEILARENWLDRMTETQQDREKNEQLRQERFIERLLSDLDGIVSTRVAIKWPRPAGPRHLRGKPTAFVTVETEPSRPLPARARQAIPVILLRNEPELTEQSITVMDNHGHLIFDPRDPSQSHSSRVQAREEDVRKDLLEKLSYIKGVRVEVRLIEPHEGPPRPVPPVSARPGPGRPDPVPVVGVNQPTELEEHIPATASAVHPAPAPPVAREEQGQVLVNVPRSYYFNTTDHREPTPEVLEEAVARTKDQIARLVKLEVPEWRVEVDTFPDDAPVGRKAVLADARRKATDWGVVSAVAAVVALLTALASWIQVVRRPARLPEFESPGRRYRADTADASNPSERVRELVRRDPEAAASVLQRWATEGGGGVS
jgi:hypothetical protein